jgi:hypothetical protein
MHTLNASLSAGRLLRHWNAKLKNFHKSLVSLKMKLMKASFYCTISAKNPPVNSSEKASIWSMKACTKVLFFTRNFFISSAYCGYYIRIIRVSFRTS